MFAGKLDEGLNPTEFRQMMLATLGGIFQSGGEAWMFYGQSSVPVGLVVGHISGNRMEPHVFWFPEATPRNRIECSLLWLKDMKSRYRLFIFVGQGDWKFFDHLCKYGVIRPVGKYRNFSDDGDVMLYQGVS